MPFLRAVRIPYLRATTYRPRPESSLLNASRIQAHRTGSRTFSRPDFKLGLIEIPSYRSLSSGKAYSELHGTEVGNATLLTFVDSYHIDIEDWEVQLRSSPWGHNQSLVRYVPKRL